MSDFNTESSAPTATPAAPADTGAPSANPAIQDINAATPAIQGTPASAPTPQATPEPSWLRGRLQETREAAMRQAEQKFEQERQQSRAQYEAVQRQLHALVGVAPQADPEVEAIRAQFNKLFPGLAKLEQQAASLEQLAAQAATQEQQIQHYWSSYGRQQMDRLFDLAGKSMGNLTDAGKRQLHAAFAAHVQSSPEAAARYAEDPTLVEEFWHDFSSSFIDPVRRSAAATVETQTGNRAFPQDTPAGVPQTQAAPKPGNMDDRMAGAWASFNASKAR